MKSKGLNNSLVVDTQYNSKLPRAGVSSSACRDQGSLPRMGWLGLSPEGPIGGCAFHQVRESERTSRQMERQNPVHQTPPICPLKMLFLLCSGSLAGLSSAKGMLKMPTHFPCQLGLTFCLNLCGILIRAREREKGEKERGHLPCVSLRALTPSLGPHPRTWLFP